LGLGDYFSKITTVIQNSKNALLNLSEIEVKVLNATSNEPWGPSTTEMREIAKATHSYANFPLIMNVIWKRLTEEVQYWRQPYKALTLLDFLVKMGSEQVIREARVHVMEIQSLVEYQRIDSEGDQGSGVRDKSKALIELIHDDARIKEEREKARQNAAKFMVSASSERRSDNYRSSDSGYPGFSSDTYESNGRSGYDKSYGQNRSGYDSNNRSSYDSKPSSDFNRSDSSRQPASRYDDEDSFTSAISGSRSGGISPRGNSSAKVSNPAPTPTPAPAPLPNLIDITEFAPAPPSAPKPTTQPFIPPPQHNQTSFPRLLYIRSLSTICS
jgi:epsin